MDLKGYPGFEFLEERGFIFEDENGYILLQSSFVTKYELPAIEARFGFGSVIALITEPRFITVMCEGRFKDYGSYEPESLIGAI